RVFDAMQQNADTPQENTVTERGLTMQATPLAMDREGKVLVRVRGWLGQSLLGAQSPIQLTVGQYEEERWRHGENAWNSSHNGERRLPPNYDDSNRPYTEVQWTELRVAKADEDSSLLLFAPVEPLLENAALPDRLTITLNAVLTMDSRLQDTLGSS